MNGRKQPHVVCGDSIFFVRHHNGGGSVQMKMEKLENHVGILKSDVAVLKTDVGQLKTDVSQLKIDVTELKIDMAVIKANYATKADISVVRSEISEAKSQIILWVVGAVFMAQFVPAIVKAFVS